ncbi:hypothetical protein TSUD_69190 [Trifolium subterraneum]|uniref:Reverse transcriptase zinc-binding domain-containing protein n=1 Tax=Trifolium subterraneum TaxID=3900 RepID=A0A2Z6N856_TRISU|nr:hypothetical protein TSUD_69190 [Trifolium subterraneum]
MREEFSLGGAKLDRKIAWVRWDKVCRPKSDGGLGIRDLRAVNLTLLGKWRWKVLSGGQGIWRDIIFARYGFLYPSPHFGGRPSGFRGASLWWKDVSLLGTSVEVASDWFSDGVVKRVGDGNLSSFWFDPWVGGIPLKTRYQRLFQVSEQQLNLVDDMGNWLDGEWHWDFIWKRELSVWETELLQSLLSVVVNPSLLGATDSWSWRHDSSRTFSVKSAYLMLTAGVDRVSTRQNLLRRRVIRDPEDALCAFCGASMEAIDHLLVTCDSISLVWYSLFRWLGFRFVSPMSISSVLQGFLALGLGRKNKLGWLLIWHATVWAIWNSRNDVIFARETVSVEYLVGTVSVESLVDKVKLSSWK